MLPSVQFDLLTDVLLQNRLEFHLVNLSLYEVYKLLCIGHYLKFFLRTVTELSSDQLEIQQLARKFSREEIIPVASYHDKTGEYPWDIIKKAHGLGLMNHHIAEEFGNSPPTIKKLNFNKQSASQGDQNRGFRVMCLFVGVL